ncbi:MAG: hypothetical protein M1383_06465 [Patescibacteria group bacterium]|nr:hypothetical protein [Patescibacteria group bacterium]
MKNISPQTKSFVILFSIAVIGTFLSARISDYINSNDESNYHGNIKLPSELQINKTSASKGLTVVAPQEPTVDISGWKSYADKKYGLSFFYPPEWKVLAMKQKDGLDVLELDPGTKYVNIKIYVSPSGYYAFGGLSPKEEDINGTKALNVSDLLYGMRHNGNFYTFDIGYSLSLKPQFMALVHSVQFQ